MKNQVIATALLISASLPAAAAETWQTKCAAISELAATVMYARQIGVPMAKIMAIKADPSIENLTQLMTLDAFDQPRYSTADYQTRAQEKFRDAWYLKCAKVLR